MSGQTPSSSITGIILTGFMGAGKTTVGALLAERLGWAFVDSDHAVEARAGMTVAEIFQRQGESAFRRMEAEAVREAAGRVNVVLALGGGALESEATRALLTALPHSRLVFLEAPLQTLVDRCAGQADAPVRPILQDRERLATRWQARQPLYRAAHLIVETEGRTPAELVEYIVEQFVDEDGGEPFCTVIADHGPEGERA
jgi:shikimate kinase